MTTADLYLRLSDFRADDADSFPAREARLRDEARRLGWDVHRVIIENDRDDATGGRKPASAWKRQYTGRRTENGRKIYRVLRGGWRSVIADLETGAATAVLAEDLDRVCRDMADLLDLEAAIGACQGHARSLSGSLTLTDGGNGNERFSTRVLTAAAEKSSDDTSRRVAGGRERNAGKSYQGGRRPYGYRVAEGTGHLRRNLTADEREAGVIRDAAAAVLLGTSLKSLARDLREAGTPTVTGAAWTASTLRDVLGKPAVAGLAVCKGELRDAPWEAILDRDTWDRLTDLFASRANPGTSNAPRWLLSGYATCGVCGGPVKCTGTSNRRAYTCTDHGHVRRAAHAADDHVAGSVMGLLLAGAPHLLRPPPRSGTDAGALRAELRRLTARKAALSRMFAADGDEAALASGLRVIRDRMAAVEQQLAASDTPDPLPEFRGGDLDTGALIAIWDGLGISRQRAVVKIIYDVTILPARRKGSRFDPDSIRLTRRT